MNYSKIYTDLINKAKNRNGIVNYLTSKTIFGFVRHHINYEHLPKFMDVGINDCVYLTYREHALAHILIAKAYPNIPGKHIMAASFQAGFLKAGLPLTLKRPSWTEEQKKARSEMLKHLWENPEYKSLLLSKRAIQQNSLEYKKFRSELAIKNQASIEYRKSMAESVSKSWTEERKLEQSKRVLGKRHYNNGKISIMCFPENVPAGFKPGRLINNKR